MRHIRTDQVSHENAVSSWHCHKNSSITETDLEWPMQYMRNRGGMFKTQLYHFLLNNRSSKANNGFLMVSRAVGMQTDDRPVVMAMATLQPLAQCMMLVLERETRERGTGGIISVLNALQSGGERWKRHF